MKAIWNSVCRAFLFFTREVKLDFIYSVWIDDFVALKVFLFMLSCPEIMLLNTLHLI